MRKEELRWYEEPMQFDTLREAHEWAYSEAYNEIVDFGVPNRYRVWVEPAGRTSDSDRAAE